MSQLHLRCYGHFASKVKLRSIGTARGLGGRASQDPGLLIFKIYQASGHRGLWRVSCRRPEYGCLLIHIQFELCRLSVLKKVEINGFKSIRKASLDLGRVNIFIGGNGTGKSNTLEALGILSACLKDISELELQKRGVRLSIATLFKSAFKNTKLRATFDLKATFENGVQYDVSVTAGEQSESLRFFSENVKHNGKSYMGRSQNGVRVLGNSAVKRDVDPTRGLWDRFRESLDLPAGLEDELNRMASYAIYAPQTAFLRGTDFESVPIKPVGLHGGGLAQAALTINTLLRKWRLQEPGRADLLDDVLRLVRAPGWTDRFVVRRFDAGLVPAQVKTGDATLYFIDKYMRADRSVLSAYDSSEGTLYLLFIAALLLHPEAPKIFALDNVDNALNPSTTTKMLSTLIRTVCDPEYRSAGIGPDQVFLTSHNPTSLDAFDLFNKDQRIFVVKRVKDTGVTEISPLKVKEGWTRADWVKAAAGKSLSELWIEGKITGALGL